MEIFLSLLFVNNDLYVCFIRAPRSIIIIGPVYLPTTRRQIKVAPLFCSATVKVTVFTPPRKIQRGGVRIELNIHLFGNGKWTYHIHNFERTNFLQALLDWLSCVFVIHLLFIRSNKSICKCDQKLFNYVCMTGIYIVSWPFKTRGGPTAPPRKLLLGGARRRVQLLRAEYFLQMKTYAASCWNNL